MRREEEEKARITGSETGVDDWALDPAPGHTAAAAARPVALDGMAV